MKELKRLEKMVKDGNTSSQGYERSQLFVIAARGWGSCTAHKLLDAMLYSVIASCMQKKKNVQYNEVSIFSGSPEVPLYI